MRIEDLLMERKGLENQIKELKNKMERANYEVVTNGWREMTNDEKRMEKEIGQKEFELRELIISQINRIINLDDNDLKVKFFESIPEEYKALGLRILPYARITSHSAKKTIEIYLNRGFLNGHSSDTLGKDFDGAVGVYGPDGIKVGFLNDMLEMYGAIKIDAKSRELTPIEDHILNLIASFSSQKISIELFKSIFGLTKASEIENSGLFSKFVAYMKYYQAQRKKYDSDLINGNYGAEAFMYYQYYSMNSFNILNMLKKFPEDVKTKLIELGKQNSDRIEEKRQPEQMDDNSIIAYLCGREIPAEEASKEVVTPSDGDLEKEYQELKARVAKIIEERRKSGYYDKLWQGLKCGALKMKEYLSYMLNEEAEIVEGLESSNRINR